MDNPKIQVVDRATGETRSADSGAAVEQDFRDGKIGFVPGSTVPVFLDGAVAQLPVEKLQTAMAQGVRLATKQDQLQYDADNNQLRAAVEGGARSLTFGASDLLARAAGADPEALQARAATEAAGMGEGAGMAAQALYGLVGAGIEGAGWGARALQAAMKPTQLVDDLGRMVATRAEGALAQSGASPLVARALGMGAAGTVEGAVVGGMQGMSEAALGNPDLNAEVLLSAAAQGAEGGALFGGVGGAVLGGLTSKVSKLKSQPLGETVEELNEVLRTQGVKTEDKSLLGKLAAWLGKNSDDANKVNSRSGQSVLAQGEQAVMESTEQLSKNLDEIRTIGKELDDFSNESRARLVRDQIPDTAGNAAAATGGEVVQQLRSAIDGLDLDSEMLGLGTGGGKRLGSKLSAAVDEMEDRVFKAAGVERKVTEQVQDGIDAAGMPKMRSVERTLTLDDLANKFDNGKPVATVVHDSLDSMRVIADQALKSAKTPEIAERFQRVRDSINSALQSESTFGDAAKIHKQLDLAAAKRAELTGYLDKNFRSENGKIVPESVRNHVASLINVDADTSIAKVKEFVQANKDLVNMLEATGADVRQVKSHQARLNNLSGRVDSMEKPLRERVAVFNAVKRLKAERGMEQAGASNVAMYGIGAALHGATGVSGAPLYLGAAAAHTILTDPARFAYNRAKIGAYVTKKMTQLNNSVIDLVNNNPPAHYAAVGSRMAAQITGGKTYEERAEAFRKRIDQVQHASSMMGQQQMADGDKDFSDAAPEHANALAAKQDVAVRMLLQAIPVPIMTPGGLGTRPPLYTDSAMRRFARLDRAIQDPHSIIQDAMNGNVSLEARQALHTLYPQLALTINNQVVERLGSESAKWSPQRERAIKLLLTPPGQNDMARLNALQSLIAAPPMQAPQGMSAGGGPAALSPDTLSTADKLLQ